MGLEGFERGARMIFSFPRFRVLAFLTAVTAIVALYVGCNPVYLFYTLVVLPILLKLSAPKFINPRRALGLVPFFIAWSSLVTALRGYSPLMFTPPTLLVSTVSRFLSNRRAWPLLVFAFSLPFVLLDRPAIAAIHFALFATVSALTELYIRKLGRELHDFGGVNVLTAYLNYALGGAKEQLAELLAQMSVTRSVPVYALDLLDENGRWGIVVVPHVHPGPFKSFGSSRLPRLFVEEARKRGLFCMVLHGASTHREDLAREEDARELATSVIGGCGETLCEGSSLGVAEWSNGVHRAVALALEDGWSLVIAERTNGGMEDIPLEVAETIGPKVVLIDAHNSYDNPRPSPQLGDPLAASLIECATLAIKNSRENISSGWRVAAAQWMGSIGAELGGAGVSLLQLQHGTKGKLVLASFDANNMLCATRDALYSQLAEPGSVVVLATTDTHELTGARPGATYDPLGTSLSTDEYAQVLESLLRKPVTLRPLRYRLRVLHFTSSFLDLSKLQRLSSVVNRMLSGAIQLFALCFSTFAIPLLII